MQEFGGRSESQCHLGKDWGFTTFGAGGGTVVDPGLRRDDIRGRTGWHWQGNRVNTLRGDEGCEEVIVPSRDLAPEA